MSLLLLLLLSEFPLAFGFGFIFPLPLNKELFSSVFEFSYFTILKISLST
jgi:hypothetical protein